MSEFVAASSEGYSLFPFDAIRAPPEHLDGMKGRVIFETEAQQMAAVKANQVEWDESVALEGEYSRICRPSYLKKPVSFFFWTKDNPEDQPSWDKVVRYFWLAASSSTSNLLLLNVLVRRADLQPPQVLSISQFI